MLVGGQRYAPAALPPKQTRYPLYRKPWGFQRWSGKSNDHKESFYSHVLWRTASCGTIWHVAFRGLPAFVSLPFQ